jgi:MoaA/NifB/PqqE/SkfB family radical SAM enzyme
LTCSIDGASQETYEQYRRRGSFDRVVGNVRKINQLKKRNKSDFPLLTWQFVAFGHNEHEIDTARKMARELDMDFYVKPSWDPNFSPVKDKKLGRQFPKTTKRESNRRQDGGSLSPRKTQSEARGSVFPQKLKSQEADSPFLQKAHCSQLWNIPQVNWDGRVLGCCVNSWSEFGNAFDCGLTSALNNDKLTYARRMLRGLEEPKEGIACSTCHRYEWIRASEQWMTDNDIKAYRSLYKMPYALGRAGIRLANRFPSFARAYLRLLGIYRRREG